jgi:hypothetical protein
MGAIVKPLLNRHYFLIIFILGFVYAQPIDNTKFKTLFLN